MDLMQRRRELLGMQSDLPSAYQRVEWLYSDSDQYIVLDCLPDENDVWEIRCQLDNVNVNTGIFGSVNSNKEFNVIGTNSTGLGHFFTQIGIGNNYRESSVAKDTNVHTHIVDLPNRTYSVDGEITSLAGLTYSKSSNNYGLWRHNGATSSYTRQTAGKIFYCKISDRVNLFPCVRKADSKPGMYDTVSKTFYTNAGTGEFIVPA
jgi:hypothetical protein